MQWEYKTAPVGNHDENAMGQDGWEMVAIAGGSMVYKRALEVASGAFASVETGVASAVDRMHGTLSEMLDHMRHALPVMTEDDPPPPPVADTTTDAALPVTEPVTAEPQPVA
ncbi:MAG TPA: hypothetical protein VFV07_09875 [Rhizomicrobium sp.]|nr:hypothetical protein [Rhizomicrobium sp.]